MPIGVIVNAASVAIGGVLGALMGGRLPDYMKTQMNRVLGVCSIGMGISSIGVMKNMPAVVFAIVLGSGIGLAVGLGGWIYKAGELMQRPIANVAGKTTTLPREEFMATLVTVIVLFCASGTGIYGSLDAGMTGDSSILISKSILDLFTALVFACNLGYVVSLVALPQMLLFLILFFAAQVIVPLTTPDMIADFKACGGILMVATGLRITKICEFPIADMVPAMVLVMPFSWGWSNWILSLIA